MASTAAHIFVADLDAPEVADEDRHHLERVLRLRPGEVVTVSDGRGRVRACRMAPGGLLEAAGETLATPSPRPEVTVGFALIKGGRPELVVQKLTECGVDRIVPFVAARSVVRWEGERADRQAQRLDRIAREAAMQSRRVWLPVVEPVGGLATLAGRPGAARAEPGGAPPDLARPVVLVGPEGGWSDDEVAAVPATVGVGPTVMRSETAAIAAGCLLVALRSGIVTAQRGA